jgi:hypothetical protein
MNEHDSDFGFCCDDDGNVEFVFSYENCKAIVRENSDKEFEVIYYSDGRQVGAKVFSTWYIALSEADAGIHYIPSKMKG